MKIRTTTIITTFVLLLGASIPLATAQVRGSGNQAKLVVLTPVTFKREQHSVEAVGTAQAVKSVTLFPAAADQVTSVNFVPGQKVAQGDVLLSLDDRRQVVAIERAKIELNEAERGLQRLLDSKSRGAVAQSAIDLAQTTRDLAKISLAEAQTNLDDRRVIAPFSGVVGFTDVEVGDRITLTTPITTLDDRHQLFVNFSAPESAVDLLLHEKTVLLQPWTGKDTPISATVAQLDSRINESDRTLGARALLPNPQDNYRPGMSFKVQMTLRGEVFAAIPESALMWGATGAYIYLAKNNKATRVEVTIHQRLRGTILVDGEITQGDILIAEGIQRLREGQSVTTSIARGKPNE